MHFERHFAFQNAQNYIFSRIKKKYVCAYFTLSKIFRPVTRNTLFGTRDLFNISYSRELYLFSKFLHFEEIVRAKMAVCFEMIVSET